MSQILELLRDLVPASIAFLAVAFGYLVFLFKRAAGEFIAASKQQAEYLRDRVEVLDKSSVIFTRTIDQQENEITILTKRLKDLSTHVEGSRTAAAERSVDELASLSDAISRVATLQQATLDLVQSQQSFSVGHDQLEQLETLRTLLQHDLDSRIPKLLKSRDLSLFPIEVSNLQDSAELVRRLVEVGFTASIFEEKGLTSASKDHVGIWLGKRVPVDVACRSIAVARGHWPFLRYVQISGYKSDPPDYVHSEIYFGGATSTVRSYHLKEWSDDDFAFLKADMTVEQLHAFVSSRY